MLWSVVSKVALYHLLVSYRVIINEYKIIILITVRVDGLLQVMGIVKCAKKC